MSIEAFGLDQTDISLNFELFGVVNSPTSIVVSGTIIDGAGVTKQFERDLVLTTVLPNQSFILPLFDSKVLSFQAIIGSGQDTPGRIYGIMRMQSGTTSVGIKSTVLASGFITSRVPLYYPGNSPNIQFKTNGNSFWMGFPIGFPPITTTLVIPPFNNVELLSVVVDAMLDNTPGGSGIELSAQLNFNMVIGRSLPQPIGNVYRFLFSNTNENLINDTTIYCNIPRGITLTGLDQLDLNFYNFAPADQFFGAFALFNLSVY